MPEPEQPAPAPRRRRARARKAATTVASGVLFVVAIAAILAAFAYVRASETEMSRAEATTIVNEIQTLCGNGAAQTLTDDLLRGAHQPKLQAASGEPRDQTPQQRLRRWQPEQSAWSEGPSAVVHAHQRACAEKNMATAFRDLLDQDAGRCGPATARLVKDAPSIEDAVLTAGRTCREFQPACDDRYAAALERWNQTAGAAIARWEAALEEGYEERISPQETPAEQLVWLCPTTIG